MKPDPDLARSLSATLLRMTGRSPFFGTLALFARLEASEQIPTAATDGRDIFVNPAFFDRLQPSQQEGLLLHEVLHAALLHPARRGGRDPKLWNIAADIVINGMIVKAGFDLPEGGQHDETLEQLSAEEVYEKLLKNPGQHALAFGDLLEAAPADGSNAPGSGGPAPDGVDPPPHGPGGGRGQAALSSEDHWRNALQQAQNTLSDSGYGDLPAGLERELGHIGHPQLDWRTYLWRFLVRTPTDFGEFDRRFIGQKLYLETLSGESLHVMAAADTSGSIREAELQTFLGEVQGILQAYPHIRCSLFFADAKLHGPYPLTPTGSIPKPVGGGGTDFRPFFEHLAASFDPFTPTVAVYLTDGYGRFPDAPPEIPVLWVVVPRGRDADKFPFGEVARLAG